MPRDKEIRVGRLVIPAQDLLWQFARSGGPGGQHVNRTSSKATLRFDVAACRRLPPDVRKRLVERAGSRLTADGVLVISSQRHREQPRNVADCLAKLTALLQAAVVVPKTRRPSKTPASARARRLDEKRRRGQVKQLRRTGEGRRGEE